MEIKTIHTFNLSVIFSYDLLILFEFCWRRHVFFSQKKKINLQTDPPEHKIQMQFCSSRCDALIFRLSFPPQKGKKKKENKKYQSMERGCETEHGSSKMQMLGDQRMVEAAVLSPCTKTFSSSISLARSCSPQRLFLISNVNSTAREWKSFRTTCFVWVWFAFFFFFFLNGLRDDANQIPDESRKQRTRSRSLWFACLQMQKQYIEIYLEN